MGMELSMRVPSALLRSRSALAFDHARIVSAIDIVVIRHELKRETLHGPRRRDRESGSVLGGEACTRVRARCRHVAVGLDRALGFAVLPTPLDGQSGI